MSLWQAGTRRCCPSLRFSYPTPCHRCTSNRLEDCLNADSFVVSEVCALRAGPIQPRFFSSTPAPLSWLAPKRGEKSKTRKGRPRVPTGGSSRGTTVVWGEWGLRMKDHDRRMSATQLSIGAETIKKRLRGQKYRLYTRVCANIGVYTSGSEVRMGKGKGSFDHWASRVAVSKIIFEIKGDLHEKVVRDAFRLAAGKMPGKFKLSSGSVAFLTV